MHSSVLGILRVSVVFQLIHLCQLFSLSQCFSTVFCSSYKARKCPNTEFFLVRVFPYLHRIRRFTEEISIFSSNTGKYDALSWFPCSFFPFFLCFVSNSLYKSYLASGTCGVAPFVRPLLLVYRFSFSCKFCCSFSENFSTSKLIPSYFPFSPLAIS